jgi:deoxyribonuclease (pyrimidine dimer)
VTRINLVPPKELSRVHLVAEYRELPRVFSIARSRGDRFWPDVRHGLPLAYTLGKGHVLFFAGRLTFLLIRYQALIDEMRRRGYRANPVPLADLVDGIADGMFRNYKPTRAAMAASRARIKERS